MASARFRFYEELNDFLAPDRRKREFDYRCARAATVKNAIEALGVPHTEVELVLVNGRSVDFSYRVCEGDRFSIYPKFESFDVRPLLRVRAAPLRETRFIADSHLGALARLLRMLGFETVYEKSYDDLEICRRAAAEERIVLTRDRDLLKRRAVTHGCYVHALAPREQLREIVERLQLAESIRPFALCLHCNAPLASVPKDEVLERLPPAVAEQHDEFRSCGNCGRIYWQGTHWQRMCELLRSVVGDFAAERDNPNDGAARTRE